MTVRNMKYTFDSNYLIKLRKSLKLTQGQLAKELHVSRNTISSIENGQYQPSLDVFIRIIQFFGLSHSCFVY